jgi:hypothetical protein
MSIFAIGRNCAIYTHHLAVPPPPHTYIYLLIYLYYLFF